MDGRWITGGAKRSAGVRSRRGAGPAPGGCPRAGVPVTVMVRIRPAIRELQRISKIAQEVPQIVECYRMTGDDCFYFTMHLRAVDELEPILDLFTPYGHTTTSLIHTAPVPRRPLPLG